MISNLPTWNPGDKITAADLNSLVTAIRTLEKQLAAQTPADDDDGETVPVDPLAPVFPAKITGAGGKWQEQVAAGGTVQDFADGRACNDSTHASALLHLLESQGVAMEIAGGTANHYYVFLPNPVFDVYVAQVGGANGDDGSTTTIAFPTYTYDVFLDAAHTIKLASAVAVEFRRPLQIAVTAGIHGLARWNGSTLVLLMVDEFFARGPC